MKPPESILVIRLGKPNPLLVLALFLVLSISLCSAAVTYSYDPLNRLTQVTYANGSTISYTYDPAGNRLTYSGIATNGGDIAPTITTPPQTQTAVSGNTISFTVAASGSGPLTYQWQLSTDSGGTWINLSNDATYAGVQATTLTLNGPTVAMNGYQFRAVVSNGASSSTPSPAATLTVRAGGQFSQQGPKLVGTGAVGIAAQGNSASLSADGNTAIVGGYNDNGQVGAAWVWTRSAGVWTQQGSKLVGSGAVGFSAQGQSVSLSADGNTAIVGGDGDNNFRAGAAWVWTRSGGVWSQQGSKLVGSGAVGNAEQGGSVSISADGNTAIVGGGSDNSLAGAAWVWTRSGGVWTQQGTKLVGSGAVGNAQQGRSVSLSADGNTAIVGGVPDNNFAGAAWVWTRSGGVWSQQGSKLVGSGAVGNAEQGGSVSISADGNTAIVGGSQDGGGGAAWVWTRSGAVWTQQGVKLVGSGAVGFAGQGAVSLSANGNTAIVGGWSDNNFAGAAWIWTRSGGVWTQQGTKLVGSGAVGNAWQGGSVSLSADGTTAIVGGVNDNSYAGAAWVFAASEPASPGTVVAWGGNDQGQTNVPAGLSGVAAIAAGGRHTVALKSDGTVVVWGWNALGQANFPAGLSEVSAIAAGENYTVALKNDGTVMAWGYNIDGQTTVPAGLSGVTAIAAGGSHVVALKSDGTVVAWGAGRTNTGSYPEFGQSIVPAGLSGVTAIAAGAYHTVALKSDGTVAAWGSNSDGQTTVPAGLSGVIAIAAGSFRTVALKSDGTVVAWAGAGYGQTPVPADLSGVTAIAAGYSHTLALKSDGTVVAWGGNGAGQTTVPAGLSGVTAIAAGWSHTVARVGTGAVGPTVTARSTGNNLTLLWPDSATGYRVESALSLSPPTSWSTVTGTFQTNGGFISIILPTPGAQKFYRLVKP